MERKNRQSHILVGLLYVLFTAVFLTACSGRSVSNNLSSAPTNKQVILATTTSTQDSGLLDFLLPIFHEQSDYIVKTIAVGTGKALKMAEEGNADVLLVHAPSAEKELMENGFGINRYLIMHNDFIIVGPPSDPTQIKAISSASRAFEKINNTQSTFVSRGDNSGTHKKESSYWQELGISPGSDWYIESGQGMGATLRIASEKSGYTLTDRATFLANQEALDLSILVEGDNSLLNVYHAIVVNPQKWPRVNFEGAEVLASFFISQEIQDLIGSFGVDQYGQPLFIPDADKTESDLGLD
jgi:tungstate transport system substrate-binding protein